jgi:hypothetical protein
MALTNNIKAYYKLNEASGDAIDATGNGYTMVNTSVTYSSGKINNGAVFNGSTSVFKNSTFPRDTSAVSFSGWFKTSGNTMCIFGQDDSVTGSAQRTFQMQISATGKLLSIFFNTATNNVVSSITTVNDNTWRHFVTTYSGTETKLYINATLEATDTSITGALRSGTGMSIGTISDENNQAYFNGTLDEIGIWSRVLSQAEVTQLYNSGAGLQYPFGVGTTVNSGFFQLM